MTAVREARQPGSGRAAESLMLLQAGSATMRLTGWLFALCVLVAFTAGAQGELQGGINPIHLNMKEGDGLSPETWTAAAM